MSRLTPLDAMLLLMLIVLAVSAAARCVGNIASALGG